MVLKKQYSMPDEALVSQLVPHAVPFGSYQQQEWAIKVFLVHAMNFLRLNGFT